MFMLQHNLATETKKSILTSNYFEFVFCFHSSKFRLLGSVVEFNCWVRLLGSIAGFDCQVRLLSSIVGFVRNPIAAGVACLNFGLLLLLLVQRLLFLQFGSTGARTITDRRTRLNPKSIKCCMLLKNWLDEEYRLKNLKRLERYKIAEMNEDEDSEDGEPDIEIRAQGDENEPDIERFYFPTMDYTYSSSQDPDFTYEWQHIPD
ncbi:uncharacterized protein LOC130986088 [Salvia miltiorrhiza]|uniref:uncharacterized protein LOC130986088 n=1 Tax=Salvia miltiorrhiza TaxID=226208 RepID=UPI0025AD7142|nr:uncharacterized protein LOC130986088 [Salvia miltiorrhiza]